MRKTLLLFLITLSLSGSFALQCAKDLAGQTGTCINETYYMRFTGVYAYYGCTINVDNTWWYYENCTGTVSSATITADSGEIIAEAWSNDAAKSARAKVMTRGCAMFIHYSASKQTLPWQALVTVTAAGKHA